MMKHTVFAILLLFLLALSFTGCQGRKNTATTLSEAEALMYTYPDSALQMLEDIPHPERLTGREQADYALLLSFARYRCYIPIDSDSLINLAIQYYKDTNDADKCAKAWYTYGGIIDEMGGNQETVIHAYKESENCIPQMKDSTLIALIYSNLAYLNKKALQYELAKTYYQKAEHINRLSANHRLLASNYLNLYGLHTVLEEKDSVAWCVEQMLQLCPILTDSVFLAKIYHNIGVWHGYQFNPMEAERFYIRSLRYTPSAPSYKTLTALADLYEEDKADSLYQQALAQSSMNTRIYIYRQLYRKSIKEQNFQMATVYAKNYIAASDSFYKTQFNNKTLEAQLKYDQLSLLHKNTSLERNLYLSILIAIVILFVTGSFIRYYRKKQKEMISITHILQQQIDDLKSEMKLYNEQEKIAQQKKIDQLEKVKAIYTSQGYLDITEIKAAGTMKTIVKELKYVPKNDRIHLIHWLNIYRNGFATRLERAYPQLTQERQLDVCYLSAAGFDAKHIAQLLNIKERTVERYMTDICKKTQYPEEGKKGFQSLILQLCIHPEIKKMLKTSQVLRNLANKRQRISSLDISHSFSSFPMDFSKRIMTFVQTKRHKDMKKPFFILKSIALFVALMWGMSLPCIADKKPIPTIDPIELEGKIEDERDRTLLLPVEAWTNGNELNVMFHYVVSNVTITISGLAGVVANHVVSFSSYQSEVFDISSYSEGTYTLVITTPQGTYLTGVFEVD